MVKAYEQTTIERKDCPFCGKKFLVRLRISDITDIKGWIMATKAKETFKAEYQTHIANCIK